MRVVDVSNCVSKLIYVLRLCYVVVWCLLPGAWQEAQVWGAAAQGALPTAARAPALGDKAASGHQENEEQTTLGAARLAEKVAIIRGSHMMGNKDELVSLWC